MSTNAFIAYDATRLTYTIQPGALTSDIQDLLNKAPEGTTFYFAEGTHTFTDTINIKTDGIKFIGAGEDKTTFVFDFDGDPGHGIFVQGKYQSWTGELASSAAKGDMTIELENTAGLKAGDIIQVQQQNTREWLDDNGYDNVGNSYMDLPINESLVEIASVSGNNVTLKTPITHDMDASDMATTVKLLDPVHDVKLADFSVEYTLGESNPDQISNAEPDYTGTISIYLLQTVDAEVQNVSVDEAPSHSMEIRTSLTPYVNHFSADGAHNKGDGGNGYGLQLAETYYGKFENLVLTDMRHAFVFSAWHTEVGNQVHILSANRDINYHGGPDYNNVVVVESDLYDSPSTVWRIVSPGGSGHPYTDIDANTTVFGVVQAGEKQDVFHGWDLGAWMDGGLGNDTMYGGSGNDIILSGEGYDDIYLGSGNDTVAFRPGDGSDDIYDFGVDDKIVLDDFGISSFGSVSLKGSSDTTITVNGERLAVLHGIAADKLAAANFIFNDGDYFIPPKPADYDPGTDPQPDPEPDPDPQPDPEPDPDPDPVEGITVNASSKADTITGTEGDDTVAAYGSQFNPGDTMHLGAGFDTLEMQSRSFTFDSSLFTKISGLDHLDLTQGGDRSKVILDQGFLERTDNGEFTISFGTEKLAQLDTSSLQDGEFEVTWASDSVTVKLKGSQPDPDPEPNPDPDPDPQPEPVDGDTYYAFSRVDKITGTDGDDTVEGFGSQIDTDDVYVMGEGMDSLTFRSYQDSFDSRLYSGFDGIDRLDVTNVEHMELVLDDSFLSRTDTGVLTISYDESGIALLDTSAVDKSLYKVVLEGGGGEVRLWQGDDTLYGSAGNDIIYGAGGADTLDGGGGADIFRYSDVRDAGDVIAGFGQDDALDLTALFEANDLGGKTAGEAIASGHLAINQNGDNVNVAFDADGTAGNAHTAITLVTLEDTTLTDIAINNNLIA